MPTRRRASPGPRASHTSAKTNGLTTLMIGNSAAASPATSVVPVAATMAMPNRSAGACANAG